MDELQYYHQIGKIQQGGMGQVLHLRHKLWDMDLAMKQPRADHMKTTQDIRRFHAECERWILLGIHPNIVQCFYVQQIGGIPSAFSEWIGNGSLRQHMAGPLYHGGKGAALYRILDVALQSAMGLQYSHGKGIVHLDVKPDNILLERDGSAKLTDFGISALLSAKINKRGHTPLYCAPEQKMGRDQGKYTDVYCWGVTVLHMLVGKDAPWDDGCAAGLLWRTYLEQAVVTVPAALKRILDGALKDEVRQRTQNFDSIVEELLKLWKQLYHEEYPRQYHNYESNSMDAMNNRGISYMAVGKPSQAVELWRRINQESLDHVEAYYNSLLYMWRYEHLTEVPFSMHTEDAERKFGRRKSSSHQRGEGYLHYLESRWAYSTGAYALACQYARLAAARSPEDRLVKDNLAMMDKHCNEQGTALISRLKFSSFLDQSWKLLELFFLPGSRMMAVTMEGKLEIFDLQGKVLRRIKTNFEGVTRAAMSSNGKYLALAKHTKTKTAAGYPWEIRVYDVEKMTTVMKIAGASGMLRMVRILDRPGQGPHVVGIFSQEVLDWRIPATMTNWQEGVLPKSHTFACLSKDLFGMVDVISVDEGHAVGMSGLQCACWDTGKGALTEKKVQFGLAECGKLNLSPVPGKPYLLHGGIRGGYAVLDYRTMHVIAREIVQPIDTGTQLFFPERLCVSQDGKYVALGWGDELQIRKLPDYSRLPEPLWAVCRFRDNDLTIDQKKKYDAALASLRTALTKLEKAGKKQADAATAKQMLADIAVIKEYSWNVDDYLALSAQASRFLTVEDLDITRRRGAADLSGIPCTLTPPPTGQSSFQVFTPDKRFSARQVGKQLHLIRLSDGKILEKLDVGYLSPMGFSTDLRYLVRVCKNNLSKYELFLLEWLFEPDPEER